MSWLARSIADSLLIDEGDGRRVVTATSTSTNDDDDDNNPSQFVKRQFSTRDHADQDETSDDRDRTVGVKEDLSEFTESLTRQLRGVASFLAPPPPPPPPPRHRFDLPASDRYQLDSSVSGGGGVDVSNSVCAGSRFGGVSGVSNSSAFPIGDQNGNDRAVVGITDEVLVFAMNIAHHPETWLDFPLSEEEEDSDDFEMSDAQWNHATLIEHLTPRLAALRIELCPIHMSESYFWKVYFVLLHSRLNKHDADLLSTPQIVEARAMWMKELQKQTKPEPDSFERNMSYKLEDFTTDVSDTFEPTTTERCLVSRGDTNEAGSTKSLSGRRAVPSFTIPIHDFDDEDDEWVHENGEYDGPEVIGTDDISFSDLEDDDCKIPRRGHVV